MQFLKHVLRHALSIQTNAESQLRLLAYILRTTHLVSEKAELIEPQPLKHDHFHEKDTGVFASCRYSIA